ncbi:AAA family ATPase [Kutzneria buriramensis]|uniref:Regulatory LuxR family protein n=1 Tax=Kutzneria buriramensis TaxID=1045776 RepID=A0A3E0G7C6_9PSEU|nr:AAA family ATPase [Kutzneria buriramensis]REH17951.1 regulatory LuxR family protein [Kutzneria buriramensis]
MAKVVLRGRAAAMAAALRVVRGVRGQGHGAVLLVEGEPGIGKSALFTEIVTQAARMGFGCAVGKADQIGRISPAAPLLLALRSGARPLVSAADLTELTARTDQPLLLVEDLAALLEPLAQERPLLIGVDDTQWADPVTRFLLRALPGRLGGSAILWVFTSRNMADGLVEDLKDTIFVDAPVETIELGPLTAPDIAAMAADRLGHPPSAGVGRMLDGVGGNPFFATQILTGMVRAGSEDDIPAEFVLGVRRRVGELGPVAAELITVAAVFGQAAAPEDLVALLPDRAPAEITAAVDVVTRASLVDGNRDGRLVFRHDLIRQAVYGDLPERTRRALHQRCAQFLVDTDGEPLTVATHARAAISPGDEAGAAMLADAANRVAGSMPETATDLVLAAFRAVRPNQTSWLTLGERCVELLGLVQRCSAAIDIADLLLAHIDDAEPAGRIEIAVARALWLTGRWRASVDRSTKALERDRLTPVLRARLVALQALARSRIEPACEASPTAVRALRAADDVDDDDARVLAWHALAEVARNRGDHLESLRHYRALRAVSGPTYIGQEFQELQYLDRFHDAEVMLRKARRDLGLDKGMVFLSLIYTQIWWDYNLARFDDAEAGARTLLDLALERGSYSCGIEAASLLSLVSLQRGDVAQARRRLSAGFGPAGPDDEFRVPSLLLVRGWVTAAEGNADEAAAMLSPLVFAGREDRDPWPWKPGWLRLLAHIGLRAGDRKFTDEVVALADLGAARNPHVVSLTGTALHVRGLLSRDVDLLTRAADALAGSPRPMMRASAYEDLGIELLRRDRKRDGAETLDRAWEIFHRVGATGPLVDVQNAMRQAGLRRAKWLAAEPRPATGWDGLTPSELKVARLIGAGHTNKAAADELGVSVNTISTHLRSVFAKLDVRSRVQLTNALHEHERSAAVER